ncbi:MAG TPA: NAD(P)-dependent alcohol dehydrogenase [Chthoniobacterales bacterium]|nr:NAD(P)-dependent alcohol dehydrogenase [Chthoniobacterales bacterium]
MKAVIYTEFGPPDVLQIKDIEKPVPKDNEVLVKVRAASVNPYDWHMIRGTPFLMRAMMAGLRKPKDPRVGIDCAGTVEAVGKDVTQFKPGDDVFGGKSGALAEYLCVPADGGVTLKPANVTFEQAAGVQVAGCTALQALRDSGKVQPGQKVLINGASGGVGTFAVQIAKSRGVQVTGVCSSRNVELVRSLGADRVIDYTNEDFAKSDERYDVIIDNVGTQPLAGFRQVLKPKGIYIMIGAGGPNEGGLIGPMGRLIQTFLMSPFISQKMGMMMAKVSQGDLKALADLMQTGKVTPVIDRTYPLSEIREAVRYLETGRARGKVVINIAPEDKT